MSGIITALSLLQTTYLTCNLDTSTLLLIRGAGPSGATTALLLSRLGIKSMAISRHASTANIPRAHIFDQRAMEVLRDAVLEDTLYYFNSEEYGRQYAL